jgi:hypothetical protein
VPAPKRKTLAARSAVTLGAFAFGCAALLTLSSSGCAEETLQTAKKSGAGRKVPVDFTTPGELAPGTIDAFGLKLPRDMVIEAKFGDTIHAVGRLHFEHVSNYIRDRVSAIKVNIGPSRTQFKNAVLLADDTKTLEIEVIVVRKGVQVTVRNRTKKPAEPDLSDEERWRRAGLDKNGEVTREQAE